MDYDPRWPVLYAREAERIRSILSHRALRLEHIGSTSVPGLPSKPIIDILLVVAASADEAAYVPPMEAAGYTLRIREPDWHEHRMFKGPDTDLNLHVFSLGCPEFDRLVTFRDHLHRTPTIVTNTPAPSWPSQRKIGRILNTTPMPNPRSSKQSSQEPATRQRDSRFDFHSRPLDPLGNGRFEPRRSLGLRIRK